MKLALTVAAGLLAASSFAFAADNNNGNNNGGNNNNQDNMNTGSITGSEPGASDIEKQECRDGMSGGAPCEEPGTVMPN